MQGFGNFDHHLHLLLVIGNYIIVVFAGSSKKDFVFFVEVPIFILVPAGTPDQLLILFFFAIRFLPFELLLVLFHVPFADFFSVRIKLQPICERCGIRGR